MLWSAKVCWLEQGWEEVRTRWICVLMPVGWWCSGFGRRSCCEKWSQGGAVAVVVVKAKVVGLREVRCGCHIGHVGVEEIAGSRWLHGALARGSRPMNACCREGGWRRQRIKLWWPVGETGRFRPWLWRRWRIWEEEWRVVGFVCVWDVGRRSLNSCICFTALK